MTNPIPEGYNSVTPYLVVDDAAKAIEFYKKAFGADEKFRMPMGDRIGHADIVVATVLGFVAEAHPGLISLADFSALNAHAARLETLPVFQEIKQVFIPPT